METSVEVTRVTRLVASVKVVMQYGYSLVIAAAKGESTQYRDSCVQGQLMYWLVLCLGDHT